MHLIVVLLKELLESILRYIRLLCVKNKESLLIQTIKKDGFAVNKNFYSPEQCEMLRNKIDNYISEGKCNVWQDELGADNRVYFINEIDADFEEFYKSSIIRDILLKYTGTSKPNGMVLAGRIDAKKGNLGSGGGWHRDSPITHQFKAICYLSNVNEINGPFQYIKASHKKLNVIKSYLTGIFKPGQYRFTSSEIENYLDKFGNALTSFTAEEGTIAFADTKGIHCGKPIIEGSRYVLFCYFWHGKIPKQFEKLKQST